MLNRFALKPLALRPGVPAPGYRLRADPVATSAAEIKTIHRPLVERGRYHAGT